MSTSSGSSKTTDRRHKLLEAARAGIHRYANSTVGERVLGVRCSVRIEENPEVIVIRCKDKEMFRLEFTS
jgi:hypothetical protein